MWTSFLMERKWIDIETQESNDPWCFHVSKFITGLLRHSKQVNREEDAGVHYDQVVDECKKKQFDQTDYWSVGMKKDFVNAQYWSIDKWISVLARGGRPKERVRYCLNPNNPYKFLYLRSCKNIQEVLWFLHWQDNVLVTRNFYRVYLFITSESEKLWGQQWTMGWFQEVVSKQEEKLCSSLVWIRWITKMALEKLFNDLSQARIAPSKNYLETLSEYSFCGTIGSSVNKEDCNFLKKKKRNQKQLFSTTHCLQSSLRKRHAWKPRISFVQGKAWF